jgi:uncharacterized protein (DUF305 family)
MDYLKLGAAALVAAAFAAALVVRDDTGAAALQASLPTHCFGEHAVHMAGMQENLDSMAANADPGHAALIQTMEPMHSDMMAGMTAEAFDAAFVCSMIPHHQGAIEMARVALEHGSDPWVKMFAAHVLQEQQGEIGDMHQWLTRHGEKVAEAD